MAKLSMQDVKNFKIMLHELKEAFLKKRAEAQGSRELTSKLLKEMVIYDNVFYQNSGRRFIQRT